MSTNQNNKISQEEVEHIAKLARIELSEADKQTFSQQLSDILKYIDKLNEVDTEDVKPTAQVTMLENIMRDDKAKKCQGQDELISAAPDNQGGYVKVKTVLK